MLLLDTETREPRAQALRQAGAEGRVHARPARRAGPRPDLIHPAEAGSLCGLLIERARRSPQRPAQMHFDAGYGGWVERTWGEMLAEVGRWQAALRGEGLDPGERVAILCSNRPEWAHFDLAALGLGLVTVPLFVNDRPDNIAHILRDSGARLLLVEDSGQLAGLAPIAETLAGLARLLVLDPGGTEGEAAVPPAGISATAVLDWLPAEGKVGDVLADTAAPPTAWGAGALATIVYTSGTTGPPKGVMLSHANILWDAHAAMARVPALPSDRFLSFLPLSHTLERTVGHFLPIMAGATVAYARSIAQLADDLREVSPTALVAVPRIFERVHAKLRAQLAEAPAVRRALFDAAVRIGGHAFEHRQGRRGWSADLAVAPVLDGLVGARVRARLGGRLRVVVCGGAPLPADIARVFLALGVPIIQGYGLTEASPVISVNALDDNIPDSIGPALDGVEVRLGRDDELQVRSPGVMLGYWNQPAATADVIDADGWLATGDQARIERGHLFITGRLKDIIVLANGEKVAPADLELAIAADPLVSQVLVIGEGRPFLAALVVLEPGAPEELVSEQLVSDQLVPATGSAATPPEVRPDAPADAVADRRLEQALLSRLNDRLRAFPGHARIRRVAVTGEPWSIEDGLMTPTMKLRRARIAGHYRDAVERLYAGHG